MSNVSGGSAQGATMSSMDDQGMTADGFDALLKSGEPVALNVQLNTTGNHLYSIATTHGGFAGGSSSRSPVQQSTGEAALAGR